MNDERVTRRHRVIAFDMPWHGKSSPPSGWHNEEYQLTSAQYTTMILEIMTALELDRPILIGCSIGGRIALHLALEHPQEFRAIIGLQAGAHVDPYYDLNFLHRPDVHGGEVCAAIVSGLVGPDAPIAERWETLWHYMQGGPGVFKGDLYFYKLDGDIRGRVAEIDTSRCPLFLLSGEYDYSCTPEETLGVAKQHSRQRGHHHEGPRAFSDEREPGGIFETPAAGAGEDQRPMIFAAAAPGTKPRGGLHAPLATPFAQRSGRGIIADEDAHLGQGGAAIFVTLPMEPLLVRAKACDPVLDLGSDVAGDAWSCRGDGTLNGVLAGGSAILIASIGLVATAFDRRCLNARLCPSFGVQSPGAELPVVDRLNKRHRLRDQEIALFYPFHRTPHPQALHRERCAESRVVWRPAAQPCG